MTEIESLKRKLQENEFKLLKLELKVQRAFIDVLLCVNTLRISNQ